MSRHIASAAAAAALASAPRDSVLHHAIELAARAQVSPQGVRRKLLVLGCVAGGAVAIGAFGLWLVITGLSAADERMGFLGASTVLASGILFVTVVFGMLTVLWSAYVYKHVQTLQLKTELNESVEQTEAVAKAVCDVALGPTFVMDVAGVLATEGAAAGLLSPHDSGVLTKLAEHTAVREHVKDLMISRLKAQPEGSAILETLKNAGDLDDDRL